MKRTIILTLIAALSVLMAVSCKSMLPAQFDHFVNSVEKKCASYSPDDWAKANEKFQKLFTEYKDNRSSFSTDEKKQINAAIFKYAKLAAKSGIENIVSTVGDIASQVAPLIGETQSLLEGLGL